MDPRVWILWSEHLGCCSTFEKQKLQHPACLDHSIQTRESIWYFFNRAAKLTQEAKLLFWHTRDTQTLIKEIQASKNRFVKNMTYISQSTPAGLKIVVLDNKILMRDGNVLTTF